MSENIRLNEPLGITPGFEGTVPVFSREFFDVFVFSSLLKDAEMVRKARDGRIDYGVYVEECIPFFLLDIEDFGDADVSFNMHQAREEQRRFFFESDLGEACVHIYFCDYPEACVRAIRKIGIDPGVASRLKEACFDQMEHYRGFTECGLAQNRIYVKRDRYYMRTVAKMRNA